VDRLVKTAPGLGGRLLPPLREDLKLHEAAANRDGSPAWVIQDPVTNRFFRIGWLEFEMLANWPLREPALVLQAIERQGPTAATEAELIGFVAFLRQHQLLRISTAQGTRELEQMRLAAAGGAWQWLLHNYLFFRVPLVRPQGFLRWLLPRVDFLFTAGFAGFAVVCTLLGLVLAIRQWDSFVHTFQDFLSPAGLAGYALALVVAKTFHEMGHALTATRYGVRVAHMGVAFLVMWPMLYTDTAESWKLADRRQRFAIAAAGIVTEVALAGFATLAWSLTEDGGLRSALFFLATTSWLITLAINVSPFMRFDGYFLLSDALDIPNLHQRSFALARAALRRGLLGWEEPDPEAFARRLRRGLVAFAWATWLYRLVVFLGIALAVYHFFFKALGLFLLAVELVWFIARPVWSEARIWNGGRRRIQAGHALRALLLLVALVALLAVPWQTSIRADGWLHATRQQLVYAPVPARVLSVTPAGPVNQGQVLAVLDSPDARSKAAQSLIAAQALALQLDQTVGRDEGLERRSSIAEQLAQQRAEVLAQSAEVQRLTLAAGFAGRLADLDPHLGAGVWLNPMQPIGVLYDPAEWVVDALVAQESIGRFAVGAPARFHRRGHWGEPLAGEVVAIDSARAQSLPHSMLAAAHGGRLAATQQADGSLSPRDAAYRVRIRLMAVPPGEPYSQRQQLGSVSIDGERRSLLGRWATSVAALLLRESGF
jgi:putative peptide zinc metalloprotease protein